jgi:hypothetical protein
MLFVAVEGSLLQVMQQGTFGSGGIRCLSPS